MGKAMGTTLDQFLLASKLPDCLPGVFGCIPLLKLESGELLLASCDPTIGQKHAPLIQKNLETLLGCRIRIKKIEESEWRASEKLLYGASRRASLWDRITFLSDLLYDGSENEEVFIELLVVSLKQFCMQESASLKVSMWGRGFWSQIIEDRSQANIWEVDCYKSDSWIASTSVAFPILTKLISRLRVTHELFGLMVSANDIPTDLSKIESFVISFVQRRVEETEAARPTSDRTDDSSEDQRDSA